MANAKHEDMIMKMGFDYFRETIAKILGINDKFVDSTPTELIELKIHALYMDFTFLTDQDMYIHFEFQTTDAEENDLRRFHAYETVLANKTGKNVITYVIYSGGITKTITELDCGLYKYRISPVYLMDKNADMVFDHLQAKRNRNEPLSEEDFARLSLTPLMSGSDSRKNTIKRAILLAKPDTHTTAQKTIAILYTLADKFLKNDELKEIKEAVAMTRLGQMIFDDGKSEGKIEGKLEGKLEGESIKLIKQVCKKLDKGKSPDEIANDLEEELPVIACICEAARLYAPDYDYDLIYRQLNKIQ